MNNTVSFELKDRHFVAVLAFLTLLLAFNQPWVTSMDGDSIVYATISQTMADQGNWLTPAYKGKNFFDHPPLIFWVNACLFKLLGSEEWVAKLFSGLCGMGAVLLVFCMGRRAVGPYMGFWSGIAMLLTYDFVKFMNKCRMDMPLVLFFSLALYSFMRGVDGEKKWFLLSGVFAGFCFLTKGIVACGIFLTAILLIADLRKWSVLMFKEVWLGLFIALFIPGIWLLAQYQANGSEFFEVYFLKQVQGSILGRTRPYGPFYYIGHLAVVYWPWMPFLLHGAIISVREEKKDPLWRLCLIWCVVVLAAFSFAKFKIHYYLLPMFPAMSLLAGRSLDKVMSQGQKLTGFKITAGIGILTAFFLAVSPIPLHHNRYPEISKMAPYMKEVFKEDDLIIAYRNQEGITTPSLYLVNPGLKIVYCRDSHELRKILSDNSHKRIFLYTSLKNEEINPKIVDGFYLLMENNGMRFYSQDPEFKLSGRIY